MFVLDGATKLTYQFWDSQKHVLVILKKQKKSVASTRITSLNSISSKKIPEIFKIRKLQTRKFQTKKLTA